MLHALQPGVDHSMLLESCTRLCSALVGCHVSPPPAPGPCLHRLKSSLYHCHLSAGFLLAQRGSGLWVALGLAGSVGLSSSGFILQTCGFKEGSAGGWAGRHG